jgi:uncharacterized lipoprotein YddW (UPF0748 family)
MFLPFKRFVGYCALFLLAACSTSKPTSTFTTQPLALQPKADAEFRAAWVATVANINWPSKPGLSTEVQKKEATDMLDFLQQHHFNAVIFQVRPQADALYQSQLEPWSYYLTGTQGKAPDPFYDPLQFWIEEAHKRGLELHVWLNPYRSHHVSGGPVTEASIVKKKPGLSVFLKEGYWWFDPSKKETQDHSAAVVRDLVKRYDLDGVHFDDYFYPYPSYNKNEDFPDNESWAAYQQAGGKLSRGDWRRDAVNTFIERVYREIKAEKKHVKFGLSPFGIWRPGYPASVSGFDQYDVLYADAKLWLNKGWIDYFAPQLYWPINRMAQSFPVLLGWWAGENTMKRHLWPGISVGNDSSARNVNEILSQIMISRGMLPESKGVIHWSVSQVYKNPNMAKGILAGPYRKPALVPASPWLDNQPPAMPQTSLSQVNDSTSRITWTHTNSTDVFRWVVYYQYGKDWDYTILPKGSTSMDIRRSMKATATAQPQLLTNISVTAVDRVGNESSRSNISVQN